MTDTTRTVEPFTAGAFRINPNQRIGRLPVALEFVDYSDVTKAPHVLNRVTLEVGLGQLAHKALAVNGLAAGDAYRPEFHGLAWCVWDDGTKSAAFVSWSVGFAEAVLYVKSSAGSSLFVAKFDRERMRAALAAA